MLQCECGRLPLLSDRVDDRYSFQCNGGGLSGHFWQASGDDSAEALRNWNDLIIRKCMPTTVRGGRDVGSYWFVDRAAYDRHVDDLVPQHWLSYKCDDDRCGALLRTGMRGHNAGPCPWCAEDEKTVPTQLDKDMAALFKNMSSSVATDGVELTAEGLASVARLTKINAELSRRAHEAARAKIDWDHRTDWATTRPTARTITVSNGSMVQPEQFVEQFTATHMRGPLTTKTTFTELATALGQVVMPWSPPIFDECPPECDDGPCLNAIEEAAIRRAIACLSAIAGGYRPSLEQCREANEVIHLLMGVVSGGGVK